MTTPMDPTTLSEEDSSPTNGTSIPAIIACNSVSIFACIVTLTIYIALSLKKKYKRLMRRTSLVLAACMATTDLVLHCSNLAGYGDLPPGFACAFVGGWMFATPTLLSIFYSCCIALNSQLAFVFKRRPPSRALGYFTLVPILVSFLITFCALGTGAYGYDETWGYCWYSTSGISPLTVLIRIILTYSLPTLICILYLLIATVTISLAVFASPSSPIPNTLGYSSSRAQSDDTPFQSHTFPPSSPPTGPPVFSGSFVRHSLTSLTEGLTRDRKPSKPTQPQLALSPITEAASPGIPKRSNSSEMQPRMRFRTDERSRGQSRKKLVMRQLTIRLIGYIVTPILCLLPGIILDLITKVFPDLAVPTALNAFFDSLNGLVGLFNALLMLSDPALLAVWNDLRIERTTCTDGAASPGLRAKLQCPFRRKLSCGSSTEENGARHGKHRRDITEDVVASGFGLGARTRVDVPGEEEIAMEEGQAPTSETSHPETRGDRDEREKASAESGVPERDDERSDGRPGLEQGLEVHVRVDVTRDVSRVQLMEDWLSGL